MASAAMMFLWNRPVVGREGVALELLGTMQSYLDKRRKSGHIDGYETVILRAHATEINGFILVRGEPEKLEQMRHEDEMLRLVVKGNVVLQGFGVVEGYIGAGVEKILKIYRESI